MTDPPRPTRLHALPTTVRARLEEPFRRGDRTAVETADLIDEAGVGRVVDLEPFHDILDEVMRRFGEDEPDRSDHWLAPRLHAALRLTRREAGLREAWYFLNVAARPDYVRWRFTGRKGGARETVPIDRFLGEDSKNALARLWWTAEMTRDGADYGWTERVAKSNRFYVSWLVLDLMHHRPAAQAVARILSTGADGKPLDDAAGQRLAKRFNLRLSTENLDALSPNPPIDHVAVREWLRQRPDPTLFLDDLPVGPDEDPVPPAAVEPVLNLLEELLAAG